MKMVINFQRSLIDLKISMQCLHPWCHDCLCQNVDACRKTRPPLANEQPLDKVNGGRSEQKLAGPV